ncbi:MAG: carboxypeptidase-like regulatory domain-containing protein [Planctomycetota bacterium]
MSLYRKRILRGVTAGITTAAMVFQPQLLVAGETTTAPVATIAAAQAPSDIVLQDGGLLIGRIIDAQGKPVAMTPVSLQSGGKEVARVVSDESGRFEVKGLTGGVYQIASTGHQGVYRIWAPRTAPPAAVNGLSIVSQPEVIRGQYGPGPGNPFSAAGQWIAEHPIITAGAVAAAIAIPIAVDDDDDPPAS